MHRVASRSTNEEEDSTIPSSGRYMVGKLAPKSTQFARGLVKSPGRPGRGFFVPSPHPKLGYKFRTSHPHSLNDSGGPAI